MLWFSVIEMLHISFYYVISLLYIYMPQNGLPNKITGSFRWLFIIHLSIHVVNTWIEFNILFHSWLHIFSRLPPILSIDESTEHTKTHFGLIARSQMPSIQKLNPCQMILRRRWTCSSNVSYSIVVEMVYRSVRWIILLSAFPFQIGNPFCAADSSIFEVKLSLIQQHFVP